MAHVRPNKILGKGFELVSGGLVLAAFKNRKAAETALKKFVAKEAEKEAAKLWGKVKNELGI